MKKRFDEIFQELSDGSLRPKQIVKVGGVQFGPGIVFSKGVQFAGIDFSLFKGHDLEVEEENDNGILIIKGIYR